MKSILFISDRKKSKSKLGLLLIATLFLSTFYSCIPGGGGGGGPEGMQCIDAQPFCSGEDYSFTNVSNGTVAPAGPNYGCLSSQPNPIWYYMSIGESGPLNLTIRQTSGPNGTGSGMDVDYAMWGPFTNFEQGCNQIMGGGTPPTQCSYSASATETISIANAQAGQVYIVIMTNYNGSGGYISLEQTNAGSSGAGSTDCSIVEPCNIENFTADISPCNNDIYSISGSIRFSEPPEEGDLIVEDCNGNQVVVASAPFNAGTNYTYTLNNLVANGGSCNVKVRFTAVPCSQTINYTAPESCTCENPEVTVSNINVCAPATVNLNDAITLSDPANVSFYSSQNNANNQTGSINSTVTTSGSYWVRATNPDDPTCYGVYEIGVEIVTIDFSITSLQPTCEEMNGEITLSATGGVAPYTYSINNNSGYSNQNSSGSFNNLPPGTYDITITDNTGCEKTSTETLINEGSVHDASFSFDDFCEGATNSAYDIAEAGGTFSFDPVPNDSATINPATGRITGGVGGTVYTVKYTIGTQCTATSSNDVTVNLSPVPDFSTASTKGCQPYAVAFNNLTLGGGSNCVWNFGDGSSANGCNNISHTYNSSGQYSVTLTVTDGNGCQGTHTKNNYIEVLKRPKADFTADPLSSTTDNPIVNFDNQSTNSTNYIWNFDDGSPTSNELNPTHHFPDIEEGSYLVSLVAYNQTPECSDTMKAIVEIKESLLFYIPNSFSPNGNNINEEFKPVITTGYDLETYSMSIYNRWGELLFETHDINVGWDGTYGENSREINKTGTYIWRIKIKEKGHAKYSEYNGYVNLVK